MRPRVQRQPRIRHSRPQDDGNGEDDRTGLLQILERTLARMDRQTEHCGQAIGRKLHNERRGRPTDNRRAQQPRREQGHHPAGERQPEHDRRLMAGEKDAGKKDENRKLGPTGHKGHGQQRRDLFAGAP